MRLPSPSIPDTLPLPIGHGACERGFMPPSARLLKTVIADDAVCIACERYLYGDSCAVALYHSRRGQFHHEGHMLCPWCAEQPSGILRVSLLKAMRRILLSAAADLEDAGAEIERYNGFSCNVDNAGTAAQTAEHLAISCSCIILKDGEEWTPTSHPRNPEELAEIRRRLDEIGKEAERGELAEVAP